MSVLSYVEGKKTYIVSGLSVADGLVQLVQGHHWGQILPYLFAGAFGGALRAAVAKVEAKVDPLLPAPIQAVVQAEVQKVEDTPLPPAVPTV